MVKTKFALALFLLLSLIGSIFFISPAIASPDEVEWSRFNIPTEGAFGNFLLASGSDVQHLTMASNGTLYCYANPAVTDYTLFRSKDDGYSWSQIGRPGSTVDIAIAPDNDSFICYATTSNVYRSTNAGVTFYPLSENPGGSGSNNVEITSIAIGSWGSDRIIVIGTRDTDSSEFGGVYIYDASESTQWIDTEIGNYDVYKVAFSPNYDRDGQLVAIVDEVPKTSVGKYNKKIIRERMEQFLAQAKDMQKK